MHVPADRPPCRLNGLRVGLVHGVVLETVVLVGLRHPRRGKQPRNMFPVPALLLPLADCNPCIVPPALLVDNRDDAARRLLTSCAVAPLAKVLRRLDGNNVIAVRLQCLRAEIVLPTDRLGLRLLDACPLRALRGPVFCNAFYELL